MRTILSIFGWFVIAFGATAAFILQMAVFIVTLNRDKNRMLLGKTFRRCAVLIARGVPFWSFRVFGEPQAFKGAAVVVSNHCSHADSFLISGVPWEMKWLGKKSLFKMPILGWSMWLSGDIPIHRGNRESVDSAMQRCRDYLAAGVPIMMFPEGTRSEDGELLPFKDGAFRLAIEADVPILPLAVVGTHTALAKHDWRFDYAEASVAVGEPIDTSSLEMSDLEALKARTRAAIIALKDAQTGPVE